MEIYDAAIAGGGIVGASIALELAKYGLRVMVLDRQEPGREASWAAAGMLSAAPDSADSPSILPLCKASAEMYSSFVAQVENLSHINVGYRRCGALEAFFGADAEQERDTRVANIRNAGLKAEAVSVEEARRIEPALSAGVGAAALLPSEAVVTPRDLMQAALSACRNRGVNIRSGCVVQRVREHRNSVAGVETETGFIAAKIVIIATGCFSSLTPHLQRWAPTTPARGQMMALRHPGCAMEHVLRSVRGYVVPRSEGLVVAGSTVEQAGFVKEVTTEGLRHILEASVELASGLESAQVVDTWAGLRPDTPDHLPVIGATEMNGLIFATGHYRNGILLAPITARLIGELIVDEKPSLDISSFSPSRFSGAAAKAGPSSR
jgi:glycine oxidase